MKKMKKHLSLLLSIIICFSIVTTSFAVVTKTEGIIPGTMETYEYVEFAQVSIPDSEWVFTFENVTAIVGYTEKIHSDFSPSQPIATYRFTILGDVGGFSIDNDAWIVCHYVAEEEASFYGDLVYEANSFETFSLPYGYTKGYRTYEVAVKETSENNENNSIVACVEIYFGEYVERVCSERIYTDNHLLLSSYYNTTDIENFINCFDNNIINTLSIQTPSTTTIRYNDGFVLHATFEGYIPDGCTMAWSMSNNNFKAIQSEDGDSLQIISQNKGYTTITVHLFDVTGNVIVEDSIEMYSQAGFFDKIAGFLRSLFGLNKILKL